MNVAHSTSELPRFRALLDGVLPRSELSLLERWAMRAKRLLDAYEERLIAPRAFRAALPLESMTHDEHAQLIDQIARLNEPDSPLLATPGMCKLELSLRSPRDAEPFGALVLECVHQRDREDLLHELFETQKDALDRVLQHCRDYPGKLVRDACVRLLLSAAQEQKVVTRCACAPIPGIGTPPLHEFEREIADERTWIERAALLARTSSRNRTRAARRKDPAAKALRGVHPKHHGLLRAKFKVLENLSSHYAVGVFRPGTSYDAWIRVSNMSPDVKPDVEKDARGFAIKLERLRGEDTRDSQIGGAGEQDFLLASHPVFIVRDVRDYTLLQRVKATKRPTLHGWVFLLRRPREVKILKQALRGTIDHILDLNYHSMIPYALGPHVVKYLVRPVTPLACAPVPGKPSNDYLRERMQETLAPERGKRVTLEFCLVVPRGTVPSVEDACVDWTPELSLIVPAATIEIEPQNFSTPERMQHAEAIEFTPWHTLPEHRPLGSLSRARFAVYRESQAHRARANQAAEVTERLDAPPYPPVVAAAQ
jgi:Catalase